MCSICRRTPCHPRCPNYDPRQDAVFTCAECDEYILDGENYIDTLVGPIHLDCAEGMALHDVLAVLDVEIHTAEKEVP